jgi:hypothetical protein
MPLGANASNWLRRFRSADDGFRRMFVILGWESELCHFSTRDKQRQGRGERADDEPGAELFRTSLSNEARPALRVAVRGESSVAGATQVH